MSYKFIFNEYKTDYLYGQQIFDVPKEIEELIDTYIDDNKLVDNQYLFWNRNYAAQKNQPLTNFSKLVSDITFKVHGVRIGATKLRQSHSTALQQQNVSYEEREKVAKMMAHSVEQSMKYSKHKSTSKIEKKET